MKKLLKSNKENVGKKHRRVLVELSNSRSTFQKCFKKYNKGFYIKEKSTEHLKLKIPMKEDKYLKWSIS